MAKTLPLPSIVRITNLENNRSIVARVNDRGPMVNNRLIDVSQRAAQELGFPINGTTEVLVEILPQESQEVRDALLAADRVYTENGQSQDLTIVPPMPLPEATQNTVSNASEVPVYQQQTVYSQTAQNTSMMAGGVYIQLGAFGSPANAAQAERAASSVAQATTTTQMRGNTMLSIVKAGPYASRTEALKDLQRLKQLGYTDAFIAQ